MNQLKALEQYLAKLSHGGLCIAFSGGVDSSLLLAAAKAVCDKPGGVHAVTVYTPFHSPAEPSNAKVLAEELGAVHSILRPELPDALWRNPVDRCYICKSALFTFIKDYADSHGLATVLDGTNADDLTVFRPGLKALGELRVQSPLAELGIHKAEVREMAREMGLKVAEKPSTPCLATRFPYDTAITPELLRKADMLEQSLRAIGIAVVRARIHGDILRIEAKPVDFAKLLQHREGIIELCKAQGLSYVTLDLEGFRSGSMDLHVGQA